MKRQRQTTDQGGFTLLELVVASGIFAMTMLLAFAALSSSHSLQTKTQVQRTIGQSGRFALESIARELRFANGFFSTDTAGRFVQSRPQFQIIDAAGQPILPSVIDGRSHGQRIEIASTDVLTNTKRRIFVSLVQESTGHTFLELARCVDPIGCLQIERAPLTDPSVEVTDFAVIGLSGGTTTAVPPFIEIRLGFKSDGRGSLPEPVEEHLSTTITSRQYRS